MGLLVALEGIDGSGKGTQAGRLTERLRIEGRQAALIGFPRYVETLFGRAIGEFLNGRYGTLDEVDPRLASLLYAGDRFESRDLLRQAIAENDVVVLDRYVASNLAHQGAKRTGAERDEMLAWIAKVEYDVHALPPPDLVVLLDLPVPVAQELIARKRKRSYTDRAADLQEENAAYLEEVRGVYLRLAAESPETWRVVDCLRDGQLREVAEIGDEIRGHVDAALAARA